MRFRDEISGRFLSWEVALSNPDLVIPLDDKGRPSPEIAIRWAQIVTSIIVNKGKVFTGTGPGSASRGGGDGGDDGDIDLDVGNAPGLEDQFEDGDLGEEEMY